MKPSIMQAVSLLASALREIFDESAYARFLDRKRIASSREAYAAFCREYDRSQGAQTTLLLKSSF